MTGPLSTRPAAVWRPAVARGRDVLRSLRGRLVAILALLAAAVVASGFVMVALFEQTTTTRVAQAAADAARGCDAISRAYLVETAGWRDAPPPAGAASHARLMAVVVAALTDRPDIEGGLWQAGSGPLAYAFPTYEGSGPKTDVPPAELPRIGATNAAALAGDRPFLTRVDAGSQTLLVSACPLGGPVAGVTAWTMTRVRSLGGRTSWPFVTGLAILFGALGGASALAVALAVAWSGHIGRIEAALGAHGHGDLPVLPPTGEWELDRIVASLNLAGRRLLASRERTERLSHQVATAERLAAIGRMAAGIAHEIRNPIAAMRLKAEMALVGSAARKDIALATTIEQADRLDALVRRLLTMGERDPPVKKVVPLGAFLAGALDQHRDLAAGRRLALEATASVDEGWFDPDRMSRALDNLVLNALQAEGAGIVRLSAHRGGDSLVLAVADNGRGPAAAIEDHLFEPFVTGRAEGTGLGLSIVREIAEAHGGRARFERVAGWTVFSIEVPWLAS